MIWYQKLTQQPRLHVLALGLLLAAPDAPAGRPLTVDDATIADAGNCQLETWHEAGGGQRANWAMPACNFTGNLELGLGLQTLHTSQDASERTSHAMALQGKTMLRPLTDDGWGAALVLAHQGGAQAASSINLPVSLAWHGQDTLLHANLGANRAHGAATAATWGLALEQQLGAATVVSLERYGQQSARSSTQLGLRHEVLPGRLQLDASWGRHSGHSGQQDHLWSLGLVWTGRALQ